MQRDDGQEVLADRVGLKECPPSETYLPDFERVWIGGKWDIAMDHGGHFEVWRKGNYRITVGTFELACAIVKDDGGYGS